MQLSIITINTEKKDLTSKCLDSLYDIYKKEFEGSQMEVIIVDNNSPDDSVRVLRDLIKKKKYKNYNLIESHKKLGFGANNNFGFKKSKGRIILFLNNDTIVKDRGLIDMADYLDTHQDIAILGGPLKNFNQTPQASAGKFYTPLNITLLMLAMQRFNLLDKSPNRISRVDWVKGALMMIRREVFEKLKGFDENIFMYTEDMELCYRAKKSGYQIWFYPNVAVLHKDQGSSNRTFAVVNIYKNLQYFYKKHRPSWEYKYVNLLLRTKAVILIQLGKLLHNNYLISTYEQAFSTTR